MHAILSSLIQTVNFSGSIPRDAADFLNHHGHPKTAVHCGQVADTASQLAQRFGADPQGAAVAGWMHDISAVFPNPQRLEVAKALSLDILPEEESVPLLLHQKISAVMAEELFGVADPEVLGAIGCHTTLRPDPTSMDLVLFVADKISWDQKGVPPYADRLSSALVRSLEEAAWVYQDYLWHSGKLKITHPWMRASYHDLRRKYG